MSSPVVSYLGEVEGTRIGIGGRAKLSRREQGQPCLLNYAPQAGQEDLTMILGCNVTLRGWGKANPARQEP